MEEWYGGDLACLYDVRFGDYAVGSAPGTLEVLARNGIREGLVVDLGCGSGLWARELTQAGYDVLGSDVSGAMIAIARRRSRRPGFGSRSCSRRRYLLAAQPRR